ncbi:UDP-N-acetylmuramate--L-alanine ligase [Clostridiaceae bacterium 35-E11]
MNFDLDKHEINHVHFIGIGGISMSAIAEVLIRFGYTVSGSDMNASKIIDKLIKKGAKITIGHHENALQPCDLVVYTAAVKNDNPELIKARKLNIPTIDRAEMLGLLMKKFRNSIAVAGTHGKTTTTSMISLILEYSHFQPTILVGGELDAIGGNVKIGSRDYLVTEACEYVESFLKFFPTFGIILNIEADHLDYFRDIEHIITSFKKFAQLIPQDGFLLAFHDDKNIEKILSHVHCNVITYGSSASSDYRADNIMINDKGFYVFDVFFQDIQLGHFSLSIPGEHNVYNGLAAIACCHTIGVPVEKIIQHLNSFTGTHRRFDVLGVVNDITIVDDYAHHPTEIRATLSGASKVPHNKLWCLFQPHTYSRTKALLSDFASSFGIADEIIVTDIYAAREKDTGEIHALDLCKEISAYNQHVQYIDRFEKIVDYVYTHASPGDLVLTMGAGDIYKAGQLLIEKLKTKG